MSADVEHPFSCYEKPDEVPWHEWLQFDTAPARPSSPPVFDANTSLSLNDSEDSNLWLDIQQWVSPLSSNLPFTDVQSPNSFRPYGTPLATDPKVDDYFSWTPQSAPTISNPSSHDQHTPHIPQIRSCDRLTETSTTIAIQTPQTVPDFAATHRQTNYDFVHQSHTPHMATNQRKRKSSPSNDDPVRIRNYGKTAGVEAGVMVEWGQPPQGRSKMEGKSLDSYRINRKHRACSACKKGRRKCGRDCYPYIECLSTKPLVYLYLPTDIRLFRDRPAFGHPLFSEKPELYDLKDLSLSRNVSLNAISQDVDGTCLPIQLTEFPPHEKLKTARSYITPTGERTIEMPPLCLASVLSTTRALKTYIEQSWSLYLRSIMLSADQITLCVLHKAIQYTAHGNPGDTCIVRRALKLLALGRIIELDWTFSGEDLDGVDFVVDPDSPWFGKRPVTAVLDTQLDQIVIKNFLMPLRDGLLNDLYTKMSGGKKHDWFEVFLTTFILQTNTGLLLRHSRKNAIQCGATHRYNSLKLAEEYFHGSNTLLSHFIHRRNGVVGLLQGKATVIGIRNDQEEFLRQLANEVHSQKANFMGLRAEKQYEGDMYWTHQMFFDGWTPEDRRIADA